MKYDFGSQPIQSKTKYDFGSNPIEQPTPFAATPLGVATNTVLGLPKAIWESAKWLGDKLTENLKTSIKSFNPEGLVIKNSNGDFQLNKKKGEEISNLAAGFVGPELEAKKALGDVTNFFIKENKPAVIKRVLEVMGHPAEGIDDAAKALATSKTKEEVEGILRGVQSNQPVLQSQTKSILQSLSADQAQPTRATTVLDSVASGGNIPPRPPAVEGVRISGEEDPIFAFTRALKEAKPIRAKQEALYTEARGQKIAASEELRKTTSGESGFYAEKAKLQGELPKVDYESLRNSMNQEQIDTIFNTVRDSPNLDSFEKISARNGLAKMFGHAGGTVPTEGEIKLLSRVFPEDTIKAMLDKRPLMNRLGQGALDILNVPRSIMSSFDMSAPFRQGLFVTGRKEFWGSFKQMFKDFGSEEAFKAAQESIFSRPSYPMMKDAKLAIMDDGALLSSREERFFSNFAEKLPVAGRGVRASSRAYTGFLNKVRADVFDSLITKARESKVPITDKLVSDLGKYINSATGRGSIAGLNRTAEVLNSVLFSPRLMFSRINLLNPHYYYKLDPFVRKEALKDLFRFTSMATTVLSLAAAGGATVNLNPTNADFLKIKTGNTRIDILGGFQQYIRLAAQLIEGKITSSTTGKVLTLGKGYKPLTRKDILIRFFQGKENPIASFITDWLQGENLIGEKFKLGPEIIQRVVPMITQDMADVFNDAGFIKGLGVTTAGLFGFGTQTYTEKKKVKYKL